MNWDAIGAIGDLVSGLGVIVTVAYLALQMRENTLFLRRAESNAAMGQFSSFRNAIMTSPDLARIMSEGFSNPGALSAPDLKRAMSAVDQMMWASYHGWMRERSGTTEPGEAWNAAMEKSVLKLLSSPLG